MRIHRLVTLSLLACACPPDIPASTTATAADAGTEAQATGTAPAVTTGGEDPVTDTSDIDTTGATDTTDTTSAADSTGTGDPPAPRCLETLPAPEDCGPIGDACGGATPIAGGGPVFVRGTALTRDDVWFLVQHSVPGCGEALYRAAKRGGDAHRVHVVDPLFDFEADDDAVYLLQPTDDTFTLRLSAVVDGSVSVIGELLGDPRRSSSWYASLARTRSGVITYSEVGPKYPGSARLTPTGLALLPAVDGPYLGSAPAHDGEQLFFSWSDSDGPQNRQLVALTGESTIVLAENATARGESTVAVDAEYVYFATGDPSGFEGTGLARVARSGGPVTTLVPQADGFVDQVLVDDAEVYFHRAPVGIFAVAKTGGTPRHIWHSPYDLQGERIHLDAEHLYFAVEEPVGDIPIAGRSWVVRVAKNTVIP